MEAELTREDVLHHMAGLKIIVKVSKPIEDMYRTQARANITFLRRRGPRV
jgi:hypothetical protein